MRAGQLPPQPVVQQPFVQPPPQQQFDQFSAWPPRPLVPLAAAPPAHFGGDFLAQLPVFEHEEEMGMDIDMSSDWQG